MGEIVLKVDVQDSLMEVLNELYKDVREFGNTYATLFRQQDLAERTGKTVRTIYRQITALEDQGIIDVETRRGRNGGSVAVFNTECIKFQSHIDNPFTGNTKTAKELRDKYYPNKGSYKPDNRTPEEKERDRIREKRDKSLNSKMNSNLRLKAFPDKEFFEMAIEPEQVFKTYMLSRAYNAVLLTRLETWKNQAEKAGDTTSFDLAVKSINRYKNYDVMPGEFMGTQTFQGFNQLRKLIDDRGYDVLEYMNNAFDTFVFLLKQGKNARPPYVNTLYSGVTLEKFEGQIQWKKSFEREHPYYATPGDVNTAGRYFPITQIIGRAYYHPLENSMDMQDIIDAHLSNIDNTAEDKVHKAYYEDVVETINSGDYTDEEKRQAINFFNEKISVQMIPKMPEADYIIANLRKIVHGDDIPEGLEERTREWYAHRGDIETSEANTPLTNKMKVKRGYLIDFSVNGGETFKYVWRVIESTASYSWDIDVVQKVLDDLEEKIPFTKLGDIDLEQVVEKTVPPKAMKAQLELDRVFQDIKKKEDSKYIEETLDNAPNMWYDVLEAVIGSSLRDGQSVTNETLRR